MNQTVLPSCLLELPPKRPDIRGALTVKICAGIAQGYEKVRFLSNRCVLAEKPW